MNHIREFLNRAAHAPGCRSTGLREECTCGLIRALDELNGLQIVYFAQHYEAHDEGYSLEQLAKCCAKRFCDLTRTHPAVASLLGTGGNVAYELSTRVTMGLTPDELDLFRKAFAEHHAMLRRAIEQRRLEGLLSDARDERDRIASAASHLKETDARISQLEEQIAALKAAPK